MDRPLINDELTLGEQSQDSVKSANRPRVLTSGCQAVMTDNLRRAVTFPFEFQGLDIKRCEPSACR